MMWPQRAQAMFKQIHAGQLDKTDTRIKMRVRRARDNINAVTGLHQGLAEKAHIDALTATKRLAAIPQQRNAQGPWRALRRAGFV